MGSIRIVVLLAVILFTAISSWILGRRMRRRIKRTLGSKIDNELELTSLSTWMKIEDLEEKNRGGKLH